MKTFITILLLLASLGASAQFNQKSKATIIRYDFATYAGDPIKKGWLISDSTYRMLYKSYTAADTMVLYYEKQGKRLEQIATSFESVTKEYKAKSDEDRKLILTQQADLGKVNQAFTTSEADNAKILKQFWSIGSIKLHKGTTISVGVGCLVLGYMAGKAF